MLPGLPGNPFPKTFDQNVQEIAASFSVKSQGPSLPQGQIGIILPSPIKVSNIVNVGSPQQYRQTSWTPHPSPSDLRQSLLFWDAIHLPEELGAYYELDDQVKFLKECGLIRRYEGPNDDEIAARFGGDRAFAATHGTAPIYSQLRINLFSTLEAQEPGQWAMGRGLTSPELPSGERIAGRGMLVKLTNTLPIPAGDVPLNDILEFKQKRRDELLSLRIHLSDIFAKLSSGDRDRMAQMLDLSAFEKSVEAYQSVLSESKIKSFASEMLSGFNVLPLAAEVLNEFILQNPVIRLGVAGVLGGLTLQPFASFKRRKSNEVFEYVGQYHTQLPWQKPG